MTQQEQEMIDGLVSRVRSTQVTDKDPEAEQYLQQGLAGYPDAIYVLAQTVLVQGYGLEQAQRQIADLRAQLGQIQQAAQHPSGGSFLSKIFGTGPSTSNQSTPQGYQNASQPPYQTVSNAPYPPPAAYPPPYSGGYGSSYPAGYGAVPGYGMGGGGGFLRGALQTAAGVAAGEMLFEGAESLFHGFGGGGGYGMGHPGETVINNYYDQDQGGEHHEGSRDDSSFYNPSNDASRQDLGGRDSGSQDLGAQDYGVDSDDDRAARGFADTDPSYASDDNSTDFSDTNNFDDGSGFDDGGNMGGDDGGSF
jgi:uncharacterized protein